MTPLLFPAVPGAADRWGVCCVHNNRKYKLCLDMLATKELPNVS